MRARLDGCPPDAGSSPTSLTRAARKRLGNVIYGISKAATDAMAAQTADELRARTT
jgi:hypothetical protein